MPATWTVKPKTAEWTSKTEIGKRTGTTVYVAIASEPATPIAAEAAVAEQAGATIGSDYPGTTGVMRCVSRDAKSNDARTVFVVTCEYDSTTSYAANPLNDPPTFDYGGEDAEEPYFKDVDGNTASTPALEPFPELPKRETGIVVIEYSRNVAATATYADYFPYARKINEGAVTIDGMNYTDGQVKVGAPKLSKVQQRDAYSYRVLTVTLKARGDGWDQKFELRGLYEWADDIGAPVPIADDDGNPVTVPWPLNADGTAKADAGDGGDEYTLKPYTRGSIAGLFA